MSEYEKPTMGGLIEQTVSMMVPCFNQTEAIKAKIHTVEHSGVWIESQDVTETMMAKVGKTSSAANPVFFLPFSSISWVLASINLPSLSETMLKA